MEILVLIILVASIAVLSYLGNRNLDGNIGSGLGEENWKRLSGEKDDRDKGER